MAQRSGTTAWVLLGLLTDGLIAGRKCIAARRTAALGMALVEAINRCEHALRVEFPDVRWLFFEPDLRA